MVTIVLAASKESEDELEKMGFKKESVWTHYTLAVGANDVETKQKCDSLVFRMKHIPFMFTTTSWWGMGPE